MESYEILWLVKKFQEVIKQVELLVVNGLNLMRISKFGRSIEALQKTLILLLPPARSKWKKELIRSKNIALVLENY